MCYSINFTSFPQTFHARAQPLPLPSCPRLFWVSISHVLLCTSILQLNGIWQFPASSALGIHPLATTCWPLQMLLYSFAAHGHDLLSGHQVHFCWESLVWLDNCTSLSIPFPFTEYFHCHAELAEVKGLQCGLR